MTGTERLGWTQPAADDAELSTFRYAIYVDGVRTELTDVSCQPPLPPSSSGFRCAAPLPAMSAGAHVLELATFIVDGTLLESGRSAPLPVNKMDAGAGQGASPAAPWPSGMAFVTADGVRLRLDRFAEGLARPTDIAWLPDGRLFVAEESGRVRVVTRDGRLLAEPAVSLGGGGSDQTRLLALAVDARFSETRFVYAAYTTLSPAGRRAFTVTRFREASNVLFNPLVLRDRIPASEADTAASLRVGTDGKLFVGFDDGGDPRRSGDLASPNGKILRLNPDGTTPDDQAGFTPLFSWGLHSPRGFDWQPTSDVLWVADRVSENAAALGAVGPAAGARKRGVMLASYALPRDTLPSSVAFYRGAAMAAFRNDLFIASDEGRHLLRVRFDPAEPTRIVATERLLQDAIGGVRVVAASPQGTIYVATTDLIATLLTADQSR